MVVYVDDTVELGGAEIEELTDKISKTFKSKQKEMQPFLFAGMNINKKPVVYFLEQ